MVLLVHVLPRKWQHLDRKVQYNSLQRLLQWATDNSIETVSDDEQHRYIGPQKLDKFLRYYLRTQCKSLKNCVSVRVMKGYDLLSTHEQAQAVMTRVLRAFRCCLIVERNGFLLRARYSALLGIMVGYPGTTIWILVANATDSFRIAKHLHMLPNDLTMVHPYVDGVAMGYGFYKYKCTVQVGFG